MEDPSALADKVVSVLEGMKLGAEVFLEHSFTSTVAVSSGKVESLEFKEELGAGLRVFDSGRVGFAFTSDLTSEGIREAAAAAASLGKCTDPDAANALPEPDRVAAPDSDGGDTAILRAETYRKVALAKAMEEAARGVDPRVKRIGESRYSDVAGRVEIRNTAGFSRSGAFARVYGVIDVVAEEGGESQSGYAQDFALKLSGLDPFKIGREAARRALSKLGGRKVATRRADVALDPEVTASLLETLIPALAADNVLKGKSFLAGREGREVASAAVTLVDDGRFPGANQTFPFDGEGVPTRRTVLLEGGVARGWLHSAYTARKMGASMTGNGSRSSYMGPPRIDATTLYLLPSVSGREEVLASVADGFLITELMGLHTVDTISGDFSLGAVGHRLAGGVVGEPVSGIGIAGNLRDLLRGVDTVGSDLRLMAGTTAGSTVLVRNLSMSGA